MLKLQLDKILKQKNQTAYALGKQTQIDQANIRKMRDGKTDSIRFETLEKLCKALDCSINDLFISDDPHMQKLLHGSISNCNLSDTKK